MANPQTPFVHWSPLQHSAAVLHEAPMDLHGVLWQVGLAPPLHRPSQQSALLEQAPVTGTQGVPPSLLVLHLYLPSEESSEQLPPQQSSGVLHSPAVGVQAQSAHLPPVQLLLQHSAFDRQVSVIVLQAKPLSHVFELGLHFFEQQSVSVTHASLTNLQQGLWQRVTP